MLGTLPLGLLFALARYGLTVRSKVLLMTLISLVVRRRGMGGVVEKLPMASLSRLDKTESFLSSRASER